MIHVLRIGDIVDLWAELMGISNCIAYRNVFHLILLHSCISTRINMTDECFFLPTCFFRQKGLFSKFFLRDKAAVLVIKKKKDFQKNGE